MACLENATKHNLNSVIINVFDFYTSIWM